MSKLLAFRCPDELYQRLDAHAVMTGSDRSAVVIAALRQFLDTPASALPQVFDPHRLGVRIDCVESALSTVLDRLDALEAATEAEPAAVRKEREPSKGKRPRRKGSANEG